MLRKSLEIRLDAMKRVAAPAALALWAPGSWWLWLSEPVSDPVSGKGNGPAEANLPVGLLASKSRISDVSYGNRAR